MMKLAVAGGTGIVGAHVVRIAQQANHEVLVLSRSTGVDLVAGTGLDLGGVDVVIDVSGPNTLSEKKSMRFFSAVTQNLVRAEREVGVKHHVALSIVSAPKAPYGYYAGKAEQERIIAEAQVPWTILGATQFFEFAEQKSVTIGRVSLIPRMLVQPVAAASVAKRLIDIAEGEPHDAAIDVAGPTRIRMAELLRVVFRSRGESQAVVEFPLPGRLGYAFRSGALLAGTGAELDEVTFGEWIDQTNASAHS